MSRRAPAGRAVTAMAAAFLLAGVEGEAVAGDALVTINPSSAYPEGPLFRDGILYYAEMGNDRVMRFDGAANTVLWQRDGCGPTQVADQGNGTLVVLCHLGAFVVRLKPDGTLLATIDRDENGKPFMTPNAAIGDGKGGVYFSSSGLFSPTAPAQGAVMHLGADGRLRRLVEGIHYSNGVALTPDGRSLYVSEHLARRVLLFDVAADGTLSNKRTFVRLDDLVGADPTRSWEVGPDGLAVDHDGNLYVAEYGAGHLLIVNAAGKLLHIIPVPENYITAVAFNADQSRLFITAPASLFSPTSGAVYETVNPVHPAGQ